MKGKSNNFFTSLLSQDMAKQARQVEIITIVVFVLLLIVIWQLWQFKLEITQLTPEGKVVIAKLNIFELLLSKK
jgi:hypothetical protein